MKTIKNKDNIAPAQRFPRPVEADAYMDGKHVGSCFVHHPSTWRNRMKGSPVPASQPEKYPKARAKVSL